MICKKRILFVGAGEQQTSAIIQAKNKGYQCFTIDGDEMARGFNFSNGYATGNIKDPLFIMDCALKFNVDAIVVISTDAPIVATAKACKKLGLHFVDVSAANISVNKFLQRKLMMEADLAVPRFERFYDHRTFDCGIRKIGLPVVIKPIDGSGSRGVMLVRQKDDLPVAMENALNNSRSGSGLIETFIEGPEIAVDGFVINRRVNIVAISDKIRTSGSHLLDTEVIFPANLSIDQTQKIQRIVQKAVLKFGFDNCPIHIELIKSDDGPIIVEVAARGAGFYIFTDILPYVSGVDTVSTQLQLALGKDLSGVNNTRNNSAIVSFIHVHPGIVKSIKGLDKSLEIPGVKEVSLYVGVGDTVRELKSGLDRIGHILIFTESREQSMKVLEKSKNMLKIHTVKKNG